MKTFYLPQGAEVGSAGIHYRVWAPEAHEVMLQLCDAAGAIVREVDLVPLKEGFFHGCDEHGAAGDLYKYRLNGGESFPDPFSRFQPAGVHGPSQVIDPLAYEWRDTGWQRPPFRDLVIYELHIGTFTEAGTFRSAIAQLEHVRELGANAIEIMPVGDFAGERNWGYDGVCWYAPAHAYGHPDDLRALVDAAHGAGLAVILDVVYNHFGPAGNYLASYIGQYLDESSKTPWGGAIRYGDPAYKPLRDLVLSNPAYWMREYHIDGFRLDATHAIIDSSPRHLLAEIAATIHEAGGFVIAEDPRNEARLLHPVSEGGVGLDGVWADDFHHTVRVANTRETESYLGDFEGSLLEVIDTLQHGWHFRGQSTRSKGKPRGTDSKDLPPEKFVHCILNHDQTGNHPFGSRLGELISPESYRASSALLCLGPGTPLLFMGQEWNASSPFQFFTDHEEELGRLITIGRREEFNAFAAFNDPANRARIPDPQAPETFRASKLKWGELEQPQHAGVLALYRACLKLRKEENAFRPAHGESWHIEALHEGVGAMRAHTAGGDWLILFDLVGGQRVSLADSPVCSLEQGAGWTSVFSSNEARFGGSGSNWNSEEPEVAFATPELILLRAKEIRRAAKPNPTAKSLLSQI